MHTGTHLDDLFITHASQEDTLAALVFLREPFDDMCHLSVTERLDALARLGVPELDLPVVARREESCATWREGDILERTSMPKERAEAVPFVVYVPQLQSRSASDYPDAKNPNPKKKRRQIQNRAHLDLGVHTRTE
jgi:hypothetical protein